MYQLAEPGRMKHSELGGGGVKCGTVVPFYCILMYIPTLSTYERVDDEWTVVICTDGQYCFYAVWYIELLIQLLLFLPFFLSFLYMSSSSFRY